MPDSVGLKTALSDRYVIEREIGAGGMATVYLARDLRHDRPVALKVLRPELGAVLGVERFLSEIRVTANLQHPNLLPLFDSGNADGQLFYVMPYVEGESLRARLDRERQLPVEEAIRIATAVAGALDYAHRQGVIHRDLKPENILLQDGQPVVADFGIALAVSHAGGERVTQTGLSLGTPQYMSPEQATGDRALDARTDQYSLAAVLYEMLTGEPPHTGGTAQAIVARVLTESPRSVRATRPTVSPGVDQAIARALSKIPADRFADVRAFAASLSSGASAAVAPSRKINAKVLIGAGVAAVAAVALYIMNVPRSPTLPLDRGTVAIVIPQSGDASLASLPTQVGDVVSQALGEMAWIRAKLVVATTGDAASARAGTVITIDLQPAGDSVRMLPRVVDATTGGALKALAPASISRVATPDVIQRALEPAVILAGFASSDNLGPAAVPSGALPSYAAFRAFMAGVNSLGNAVDTIARYRTVTPLREAIVLDSTFVQAKLWLGVSYAWYGFFSRGSGGAARADTVLRWTEEARGRLTPFEALLADFARSSLGELNDAGLNSLRRISALSPRSNIASLLPNALLDLNRPREAQARFDSLRAIRLAGPDSANAAADLRYWAFAGENFHFLGEYGEALKAYRQARALMPSDISALRGELHQLAALGDTAAFNRVLAEVTTATSNSRLFSFAGDVYLSSGQELMAHGNRELGLRVVGRAVEWFEAHREQVARTTDMGIRYAIALDALGRSGESIPVLKALAVRDTADSRIRGMLGRMYLAVGDSAGVKRELAWLESRSAAALQGTTTYERAAITVRYGPSRWEEAVRLLAESLRQGQGFGIRRRVHYFTDWQPLKDYPAFKQVLEPRG